MFYKFPSDFMQTYSNLFYAHHYSSVSTSKSILIYYIMVYD